MKLFDLHCDTASRMYYETIPLEDERLDNPFGDFSRFERAVQVYAVYSRNHLDADTLFTNFLAITANLKGALSRHPEAKLCTTARELTDGKEPVRAVLAVEGSRLLDTDINRLDCLYDEGVRLLTFVWGGHSAAGGAHDTPDGLTPFGFDLLSRCHAKGIIPDVSHMSEKGFWELAERSEAAGKPFIATHSNARALFDHTRNLTDEQFLAVKKSGGLVGINWYPHFLTAESGASVDSLVGLVCEHIEHFLSLDGEKTVALGGDRDGIDPVQGYSRLRDAEKVYERLLKNGMKEALIDDIFFNNAEAFFGRNL